MKRVAWLIAAAAVAGSGCGGSENTCKPGQMTLTWAFYKSQYEAGTTMPPALNCSQAGISTVDIFIDNNPAATNVPCTDGQATFDSIVAKNYNVMVEGVDSGGAVLYRSINTVTGVCGAMSTFDLSPARGTLSIDYSALQSPHLGFMWYAVQDDLFNPPKTISAIDASSPQSVQESILASSSPSGGTISIEVPFGYYTVPWVANVYYSYVVGDTGWRSADLSCTAAGADVFSSGETVVPIQMSTASGAFCP